MSHGGCYETQFLGALAHGLLECLIYEMLLIKERRPTLNMRADSIHAKLFN